MHPNPAFRATPTAETLVFAANRGFGTLMVSGVEGPLASHIPFDLAADGASAELHLVRSNPIVRALADAQQPALLAVVGADSYISPDWYDLPDQVPTWNYVAAHLRGTLALLPDDMLRGHLDRLSERFEQRLLPKRPWRTDKLPAEVLKRFMRMIVPCRLTITDVQGTWKLGQNKPAGARLSAADHMTKAGIGLETAALANLMRAMPS